MLLPLQGECWLHFVCYPRRCHWAKGFCPFGALVAFGSYCRGGGRLRFVCLPKAFPLGLGLLPLRGDLRYAVGENIRAIRAIRVRNCALFLVPGWGLGRPERAATKCPKPNGKRSTALGMTDTPASRALKGQKHFVWG